MQRSQLEHLIRAAAEITNEYEFVVVGSQSIVGALDAPPPECLLSMEADIYPMRAPELADLIDGAKSITFSRPVIFDYVATRAVLERRVARLLAVLADGTLRVPPLDRHSLAGAAEAHAGLEGRATSGALVLLA